MSAGAIRSSVVITAGAVILAVAVSLAFAAGTVSQGGPASSSSSTATTHVGSTQIFDSKALHGYVPPSPGMSPTPIDARGHVDVVWSMSLPSFQGSVIQFTPTGGSITGPFVITVTDPRLEAVIQTALLE